MKKKRLLALTLCFILILGIFAACGSEAEEPASEPSPSQITEGTDTAEAAEESAGPAETSETAPAEEAAASETPTEEETASEEDLSIAEQVAAVAALEIENTHQLPLTEDAVTFTLWSDFIPPLFNYMPNGMADNLVYAEMETRTGVHMEVTSVAMDQAATNLSLLLTSGDYPDIWYGFTSYYSNSLDEAIDEELIYNLADYKDYFTAFFSIVDNYDIYAKTVYTDVGNVSVLNGIWTNSSIDGGLTVRKDWMEELGLEVPTTIDEFHDLLTAFHDTYGATYYMSQNSSDPVNTFSQCFGVASFAQDSTAYPYYIATGGTDVQFSPLLDGFQTYLETMHQWYEEGLIYPDFLSASDSMPSSDLLLDGKVGLTYYSVSNYTSLMSQVDAGDSFDLMAIDVPVNAQTGEAVHLGRSLDYASNKGYSLSTNLSDSSEEFRIACEWLDYMYTDEGSELCNYGVEGTTFNYGENGEHIWTDLMLNNPEGLAYSWCLNCYTFGAGSFRIDSTRTMEYYGDGEMALMDVWNSSANDAADILPTAISLTAEESYAFSAAFNDISTHVQENILSFITGNRDLSEYGQFVAEIEGMGIADCTQILQDAVDRYNER